MNAKFLKILSCLSFVFCVVYFIKDANLPFVGPFGNNNSTYSIQAKNYLKFGLLKTKLAPVNRVENNHFLYYLHHPPILQLLTALSYKIFGQNHWWPGRFFPILATILSLLFLFLIGKKSSGKNAGWWTLFFAASSPFLLTFGKIIQFEPMVLLATLFFSWFSCQYFDHWRKEIKILFLFLVALASLIDWPISIYFIFLAFFYFRKSHSREIWLIPLVSLSTLTVFFVYASSLTGSQELINAYLGRGFGTELFGRPWPFLQLGLLTILRCLLYFSPLVVTFALRRLKKGLSLIEKIYLFFGLAYLLLFPNATYAHPYWLYFLAPFFILSAGREMADLSARKGLLTKFCLTILLILNFVFSLVVLNFKDRQVKKALWQSSFIEQVRPLLTADTKVAVSWDFNEELFRYQANLPVKIFWSEKEILKEIIELPKFDTFIFSCWANCTSHDAELGKILSEKYRLVLLEKENRAFVFDLRQSATINKVREVLPTGKVMEKKLPKVIFYYRRIRDFLGVNQI